MLVLATGIVSFGVAQTLYILAFGFQSRQIHTLGREILYGVSRVDKLKFTQISRILFILSFHISYVCRCGIIVQASDSKNII